MFFLNKKQDSHPNDKNEDCYDELLCKFVNDGNGKIIGESVSIDDDILIVKSKGFFLGFPLKHIEEKENVLLVKGLIDLDKAKDMGRKWLDSSFKSLEEEIE